MEPCSSKDIQIQNPVNDINNLLLYEFEKHNVTIYGTWEEPLFKASEIGDMLKLTQIRKSIQNLDNDQKKIEVGNTNTGLQDQYFVTEDGLYELLYVSRKPLAKKFRKHVSKLLKEHRLQLANNIKIEYTKKMKALEWDMKEKHMEEYEKKLILSFSNRNVLYAIKIKEDDDSMIVKFGNTNNLVDRLRQHRKDYIDCRLLDVFAVLRNHALEQHMFHIMHKQKIKYDLYPERKEHLIFWKDNRGISYDSFKSLVEEKLIEYNSEPEMVIRRLEEALQARDYQIEMLKTKIDYIKLDKTFKNYCNGKVDDDSSSEPELEKRTLEIGIQCDIVKVVDEVELNTPGPKVSKGPRVQKIRKTPIETELVATYDSISEACRRNEVTAGMLKLYASERRLFKGFRWYLVPRNNDVKQLYDIGPTDEDTEEETKRYANVVKVNPLTNSIVDIYATQQLAADRNEISKTTMFKYITNKQQLNGYYYYLSTELPWELQGQYNNKLKDIVKENKSRYYKMNGDKIEAEYDNKSQVISHNAISYRKLNELLVTNKTYKGYSYLYR